MAWQFRWTVNRCYKSAVVVSETDEETNTVPVESTSDTTMSTAQSDSDSEAELVIIRKKKKWVDDITYTMKTTK